MLETVSADYTEIEINRREVLRYLRCDASAADNRLIELADRCIGEMHPMLLCRACFDRFPLSRSADGRLDLGFTFTTSERLQRHLSGCDEIILFAATIGAPIDRIIQKYAMLSPLHALAAQAVGTVAIESWCDLLCLRFAEQEAEHGRSLRPRFSPGYGDFPLEIQKDIFRFLDCSRKIGVSLTESLLMVPGKSVSALVGISLSAEPCTATGCSLCEQTECEFRRT